MDLTIVASKSGNIEQQPRPRLAILPDLTDQGPPSTDLRRRTGLVPVGSVEHGRARSWKHGPASGATIRISWVRNFHRRNSMQQTCAIQKVSISTRVDVYL